MIEHHRQNVSSITVVVLGRPDGQRNNSKNAALVVIPCYIPAALTSESAFEHVLLVLAPLR